MQNLREMKVAELRDLAKELGITGRWDMNKTQLIEAIESLQKNNKSSEEGITTNTAESAKKENVVEKKPAEGITHELDEEQKELKPGKRLIETVVNGEKKVIAAAPLEEKRCYIQDAPVGTLVAFKVKDGNGNDKYLAGELINRSSKRSVIKVRDEDQQEHIIQYEDVVWVKTNRIWPKRIYQLLYPNGGANNGRKTNKVKPQ